MACTGLGCEFFELRFLACKLMQNRHSIKRCVVFFMYSIQIFCYRKYKLFLGNLDSYREPAYQHEVRRFDQQLSFDASCGERGDLNALLTNEDEGGLENDRFKKSICLGSTVFLYN